MQNERFLTGNRMGQVSFCSPADFAVVWRQNPGNYVNIDFSSFVDGDFYEETETPCQRQRAASSSRVPGPFYLQCTRDGEFKPVQCNDRECWCVDEDGREKPNSRQPLSNKPKCTTAGTGKIVFCILTSERSIYENYEVWRDIVYNYECLDEWMMVRMFRDA